MLICPKCNEKLIEENGTFKCKNNHCYDIAKKGYVNLMLANQKSSLNPGDNAIMINSRKEFLNTNKYKPLSDLINNKVLQLAQNLQNEKLNILDVGCGEGYYLNNLQMFLQENLKNISEQNTNIVGLDISKSAIHSALKNKNIRYIISSANSIPIKTNSIDVITNVFAPFNTEEFYRTLNSDGKAIIVCAGKGHLEELKNVLYDNVINLEEKDFVKHMLTKFDIENKETLKFKINVNNAELLNLFTMTPYYYTTSLQEKEKLNKIKNLNITCSFLIFTLKKKI